MKVEVTGKEAKVKDKVRRREENEIYNIEHGEDAGIVPLKNNQPFAQETLGKIDAESALGTEGEEKEDMPKKRKEKMKREIF